MPGITGDELNEAEEAIDTLWEKGKTREELHKLLDEWIDTSEKLDKLETEDLATP